METRYQGRQKNRGLCPRPNYTKVTCMNWLKGILIFFFFLLIDLLLAVLGLHCCTQAFSSCSERGLPSSCGLQTFQGRGFSCCGAQVLQSMRASGVVACRLCRILAQSFYSMWDLPGPRIESTYPVLAGRFLTTGPPGKSQEHFKSDKSPFIKTLLSIKSIIQSAYWMPKVI